MICRTIGNTLGPGIMRVATMQERPPRAFLRAALARANAIVSALTDTQAQGAYWFLALLGTVPALRANSLLPHDWLERWTHDLVLPLLDNPGGVFTLLPLGATWLLARRLAGRRHLIAVWPYLLLMLATTPAVPANALFASLYTFTSLVTVIIFVVEARVLSAGFGLFVLALFLWQRLDPVLSPWSISLFVLAVLVARLVLEAWRQNRPLLRALGRESTLDLGRRTLRLWWPMIFLIGAGLWMSAELGRRSEDALYTAGLVVPYCHLPGDGRAPGPLLACPPGHRELLDTQFRVLPASDEGARRCEYADPAIVDAMAPSTPRDFDCPRDIEEASSWPVGRKPLFDNIDLGVENLYRVQRAELHAALATVEASVDGSREAGEREARRRFRVGPRTPGMSKRHCDFPYLACEAGNLVIGELNSAYGDARRRTEARFVADMGKRAATAGNRADEWTDVAQARLDDTLKDYELRTRAAIARVHAASNLLQQLLLLWLVVVIIKSLLYVFARVIFDQGTRIEVDLMEMEGTPVEGSVRMVDEVDIAADYPHDMYYKANYQPLGPAPRFSIPQWRASMLARLRHGAWNMSRVDMPLGDGNRLTFNAIEAEHLVDWSMREGEEVVFNYGNFVAMNEHVQLRTVISLRVATLLLGRMVFHTARCSGGPGRLILRTRGKPATARQVQQSIPVARLIAWNRYARFSVDSHLTPADVFLNGFNLRRSPPGDGDKPQGLLVVEADARDGGILVGTLRFARNFLLPI